MSNPTMIYKHPGRHKLHESGEKFDYKVVEAEPESEGAKSELDMALENGWYKTTTEALKANEPPTRAELETKANELKIKFTKDTSDGELGALIEAELEKGK